MATKLLRFILPKGFCKVGHVGVYPEADADRLIQSGYAELYSKPVKTAEKTKLTASKSDKGKGDN